MQSTSIVSAPLFNLLAYIALCIIAFGILGCEEQQRSETREEIKQSNKPAVAQPLSPSQRSRLKSISKTTDRLHDQAIADGQQLDSAINRFLENTTDRHLMQAKESWLGAHGSLTTLLAIYQADKPKKNLYGPAVPYSVYSLLDATPMLPGYLDAVPGYPVSGLISALELPINTQTLVSQHQYADAQYVVFGLHPIEFFLWDKGELLQHARLVSEGIDDQTITVDNTEGVDNQLKKPVSSAIGNEQTLNFRRETFLQLVSNQYQSQLVALKKRWYQNNLGMAYLAEAGQKENPELDALMRYIDSFMTEQLALTANGDSYLFEQHYQYSSKESTYWEPVFRGIEALMEISGSTNLNSVVIPEKLRICLKQLTAADELKDRPCQAEINTLKEKIILSVAETNRN